MPWLGWNISTPSPYLDVEVPFGAISKSLGNVVEPMEIIEKFSAEGFRYYFMSQCPFGGDGEFSFER